MSFKTIIDNATGVVTQDGGQVTLPAATEQGQVLLANSAGVWTPYAWNPTFKNRIINGDMRVAQRGAAAVSANGSFPVDRWVYYKNTGATASIQQSSVVPTYFANSVGLTVTTGGSATAAQYAGIQQAIEGCNVADLGWGTSAAKTITISFFVRSSITGTYCLSVYNYNGTRTYVATYSVSAGNSWQYKSVTIPGPTDGTWYTNNATGINMWFDLGTGSNLQTASANTWLTNQDKYSTSAQANVIGTTGATFYLTGVQLEVGSVATAFELRPEQVELALCQRYYWLNTGTQNTVAIGLGTTANNAIFYVKYPQTMRAQPTILASVRIEDVGTAYRTATTGTVFYGSDSAAMNFGSSSLVAGRCVILNTETNQTNFLSFNAEL